MGSKRQNLLTGIAAACVVAALNLPAFAQQSAPIKQIPPQVLDQMSQDHPAQDFGTPPPQSSIPSTQAYSIPGLWVCKSYDLYKPIHAQPNADSPVIAITGRWGAVTGAEVNGYQEVLIHKGMYGYVSANYVHPFHNDVAPNTTCTFEGVQANGLPLLDVH
jgi:hypothetical protein